MTANLRAWLATLNGVRQWVGSIDDVEVAADTLGWRLVVIDGTDVEDKHAFLESCDEAFELPEYFAMNWDSLQECLVDLDLDGASGIVVVWNGWGEFAEADPKDFATGVDIMRTALRSWGGDDVHGGVLMLGEGPDIDVDAL